MQGLSLKEYCIDAKCCKAEEELVSEVQAADFLTPIMDVVLVLVIWLGMYCP